jgi:hypothetical protein
MCISRHEFIYAGYIRIIAKVCRHILRYAGLTYLIYCAGTVMPGYLTYGVGGPAYKVQGVANGHIRDIKSEEVSHPYNQGRKHHGMVAECDDRVHSGGIPTLTVHKYKLTSGR